MIRVGYTRSGRVLHAVDRDGERTGRTLCTGRIGFVHPDFDEEGVSVAMSLSFNDGCKRCLAKLSEGDS